MLLIGIRKENKGLFEKRTALNPSDCKKLIKEGVNIQVQSSNIRCFSDNEYKEAGCKIVENFTNDCKVIFGIKEVPDNVFEEGKTYIFFSHTHKGQPHRMESLKKMIEKKITLIDYELITNKKEERLVYFGRIAGQVGMIDSLFTLGQRCLFENKKNPFTQIKQAYRYGTFDKIKIELSKIGKQISEEGIATTNNPFVIGISGYGNVSHGAQDILNLLPTEHITPAELLSRTKFSRRKIYVVVFEKKDMFVNKKGLPFDLMEYSVFGKDKYSSNMKDFLSRITIFINGIYWEERFPRLITKEFAKKHFNANSKLKVIGDITADPKGSVEITEKVTPINEPFYFYNSDKNKIQDSFDKNGVSIMAIDYLPAELSVDASNSFSKKLKQFIKEIAKENYNISFDKTNLSKDIKNAVILWQGEFSPLHENLSNIVFEKNTVLV